MILIAAMAMTTLTVQANETIDAISEALTNTAEDTASKTEDAKKMQHADEKNESKMEEKKPSKEN